MDAGEAVDDAYALLLFMGDVGGGWMEAWEALLSSFRGGVVPMMANKNKAADGIKNRRRLYNAHRAYYGDISTLQYVVAT